MTDIEKIESIFKHIRNVQDNAFILGKKLISRGEVILGKMLIVNSLQHDLSKFYGIEWDDLSTEQKDKGRLSTAVTNHNRTNPHHPEYWGSIQQVPKIYLMEMVCDWKSRSEEFGTDIRQWINEKATKRFNFTREDAIYNQIMEYLDLICERPFEG